MHGCYRACFPVLSYFSKIFLFSCFLLFVLFFFSSKNFEFSGIFLHMVLTDPGKPGKPWKVNQFYRSQRKVRDFFILKAVCIYSGISIKRTHDKVDTSIRRTAWQGTDCSALRLNYLRKNLYKADTFFFHQWCPLYRDSTVLSFIFKND